MSMKMLKYVSLDEYTNLCTGRNIDLRPTDEIIKEIEALHKINRGEE